MYANIKKVGLPNGPPTTKNSPRAMQAELKQPVRGLATKIPELRAPRPVATNDGTGEEGRNRPTGGGSDDIGDVSWNVPTVTLRFPSNIPGGPGHNWANGISMATPIAHKGVIAGAKVQAMTMLDILIHPELVQSRLGLLQQRRRPRTVKYKSFLRPDDKPAIWLNAPTMAKYRDQMKKFYYNPDKYDNYLDQLGIKYPTVRATSGTGANQ